MSKRVLFNGVVLTRPGAATKIDASQFENINLAGIGTIGLIGAADGGQPSVVKSFNSPRGVETTYRSGDLVEAAAMAAQPSNDPRIGAGAQVIVCYKVNNSTKASLAQPTMTFRSKDWGLHTNNIQLALSAGAGSNRIISISTLDRLGTLVTETSPELGETGKFTIQYVGAGSAAVMTITATALTTTVTGGPGTENLNLLFANYKTLADLVRYIDGLAAYTCTSLITNDSTFDTTFFDAVAGVDIRTALYTAFARNYDLYNWVNTNSSIIEVPVADFVKGQAGPPATFVTVAMAGGTLGSSANAAWTAGYTALRGIRVNQLVPLAASDGVSPDTYTISSILAGLSAHCKYVSGTAGRNECQGWGGYHATKTNLIAQAQLLNSEHVCLTGVKVNRPRAFDSNDTQFPAWAAAVLLAGMRCGAPLGMPITWKYVNCTAITSSDPATWSETDPDVISDFNLNGVMTIVPITGKGFRIEKGITTYTRTENDAFMEETIVQIWKAYSYDLRTFLEDRYTGQPGTSLLVETVPASVVVVSEKYLRAGALTNSLVNGQTLLGYRNITKSLAGDVLEVGVTISPTPGINFTLGTIVLVPARISS